jgi:hypothetical protein
MRITNPRVAARGGLAGIFASLLIYGLAAAADPPAVSGDAASGVWTPKELYFQYQGFTTHYSCDGLTDKIKHVVRELGARGDFQVHPSGCSSPDGRPDPFPGVTIKMSVLQPAPDGAAGSVPAHWQRVDLKLDKDPVWEAGDCELLEQVKQKLLPLFATRNVDFASNCVPHQLYLGTRLATDLLIPDKRG